MSRVAAPSFLSSELEGIRVRFVVGIDLGTTNSAVSYVDLEAAERKLEILPIPQAVAVGVLEERSTLPSFFCRSADAPTEPTNPERRDFSTKKAAPKDGKIGVVGAFARDFGTAELDSFVSSAKSWLCHTGVDRTAKILPWSTDAEAGALRWSPVEISSFFLRRIRDAWNARFPEFPLETQDVVLTIPASFDETARELTIRAAKLAGLPKIALVEEPQAAFYAWLEGRENDWTAFVKPGEKILVCDVGGGTTDFALIYALDRNEASCENGEKDGKSGGVRFYRVAVGDHLILGGDNLDLALFHFLEQKFAEKRAAPLSARERAVLLRESRETKEFFLSANAENSEDAQNKKSRRVVLPGSGAKLVGGGLSVEVERADVEKILLDGFFPRVPLDAAPIRRRVGVREIALPYAPDPAITKYLANFLTTRRDAGLELERSGIFDGSAERTSLDGNGGVGQNGENGEGSASVDRARPDVVLFNGGAFESPTLRARIVDSLVDWFGGAETGWRPKVLQNENLYWAVAKGAAYCGLVRRGLGTRIGASLARTYYVGVATNEKTEESEKTGRTDKKGKTGGAAKAVCLLPARAEPGDEVTLPKTFELAVDRPVSFPIFVSSVRTTDAPGDLVEIDPNEIRELAPIQTALKTRSQAKKDAKTIRARLVARPTEIGTIELFLQEVLPEKTEITAATDAENGEKNGESAGKGGRRTRASRWALQFDARGGTQTDWEATANEGESEGVVDESLVDAARLVLTATFATDETLRQTNETRTAAGLEPLERVKPSDLFRRLAEAVGTSRNEFPITLLRRLAETTLELADGRRRQAAVEARWLNWLGFALRPGFGAATDDWRVEQTWKAVSGALAFGTPESRTQYWILWRRVASGLGAGRQKTLAEPALGNLRALRRRLVDGRGKGPDVDLTSQEGAEIWRLLGALELLPPETKEEIGSIILDVLPKKNLRPIRDALVWALGRVGARTLFNAPLDRVVSAATASAWARRFLAFLQERDEPPTATDFFALARLTRRSGEAAFDVDDATRDAVSAFLAKNGVAESTERGLEAKERVVDAETTAIFGETLPLGLRWN
ncbi:MAG: Hsp70 family protein [Thermoguttaceae bacterium]|nr:Hsp70 family protein [Thermoguttaceae bacterium]